MEIKKTDITTIVPPEHSADFPILYLDIETTGLARDRSILYMLGCGYYDRNCFHVLQWFNNDAKSEAQILMEFNTLLQSNGWTIWTFNGESFDLPYLKRHYELHGISCILNSVPSKDLYRILRPFQKSLHLEHGRQKDWEAFLDIHRKDQYNGGKLIRIYKEYLIHKDGERLQSLFLHNLEDLYHMAQLSPLLAYPSLSEGGFLYEDVSISPKSFDTMENSLEFRCSLKLPVPNSMEISSPGGALIARQQLLKLYIPVFTGTMKHFYPDYQNYYYLTREDRAIHKSIGQYVDKNYRKKCSAGNCYIKKEGVFLPAGKKPSIEELTPYVPDYPPKTIYYDFDELFHLDKGIMHQYLRQFIQELLSSYG